MGPDAVDTTGVQAVEKFAGMWGLPALVIAASAFGLSLAQRKLGRDALTEAVR
jgi:hypothetical protein